MQITRGDGTRWRRWDGETRERDAKRSEEKRERVGYVGSIVTYPRATT